MYPLTSEESSIHVFMLPCMPLVMVSPSMAEKDRVELGCADRVRLTLPHGFSLSVFEVTVTCPFVSLGGQMKNMRSARMRPSESNTVNWLTPGFWRERSSSISVRGLADMVSQ